MTVDQIRVGTDNFSYLIIDNINKKAALVDPGMDAEEALRRIDEGGLELIYVINTHYHLDHSGDNARVNRIHPKSKLVASSADGEYLQGGIDIAVSDEQCLYVGEVVLKFLIMPGHTPGGIVIIVDDRYLLSGDILFIGDCGRCDLVGGSVKDMFGSLQRINSLSDDLVVYPGHDYGTMPTDSLGNQKRTSKVLLASTVEELSTIP